MPYPWYETLTATNEILQGDFIPQCPLIVPPETLEINPEAATIQFNESVTIKTLNTVVVSQSCDLQNDKIEIVLVCPYYSLEDFIASLQPSDQTAKGRDRVIKGLKQGNLPSYHLLNRDTDSGMQDFCVVDFKNVYGVNFQFLKTYVENFGGRLRLLPPYREHLSQAFARFFMRVGLPHDIEGVQ